MATNFSSVLRRYGAAARTLVVLTLVLGVAYPLAVTAVGQVLFRDQARGSIVTLDGAPVGSSLIGQSFTDAAGDPLPQWFQSRPSAAGDGYDPTSTSASNLGPNNPDLLQAVVDRRAAAAELDGVDPSSVAPDALLSSGSGIDPHISPAYAYQQVERVARERGLGAAAVRQLVTDHVQDRILGVLGEERVNVVELNLAVQALGR